MKKIVLVALLALVLVSVYGQEQAPTADNNLDFGFAYLVAVSNGTGAGGPGLAVSWYNAKLFGPFGMGAYLNIAFPIFPNANVGKTNFGLVTSLLVGPSYMIYDNGVFAIPVTAGLHFDLVVPIGMAIVMERSPFEMAKINLGIGADFDFVWRFSDKWHAYARVMAVFNFGAIEFLMFPGLGVGFSF